MATGVGACADGCRPHAGQPAAEQEIDQEQPDNINWERSKHVSHNMSE